LSCELWFLNRARPPIAIKKNFEELGIQQHY